MKLRCGRSSRWSPAGASSLPYEALAKYEGKRMTWILTEVESMTTHIPVIIPADVPLSLHAEFCKNYTAITFGTGRLFLFAADHKIEHLDTDFYGPGIDPSAHHPEHILKIASAAHIGALATQLGLIARFGKQYPHLNYIAKLNSKTNLLSSAQKDPLSRQLWSVEDVIKLKEQSKISICGIGLTVYLGSAYEDSMLAQAAEAVFKAHQHGLVAILWMYPRGQNIKNETDALLIAGATGVATCLGADFVKIHPPASTSNATSAELLQLAVQAAGNTKVICAGGKQHEPEKLLQEVQDQLTIGGSWGAAIGRNIYQHSLPEAVALANKLSSLIYQK